MDVTQLAEWAAMVGGVIGLTEIVKRVVFKGLDHRFLPLFALALGVAWTVGLKVGGEWFLTVMLGLLVGLASMGLFSGVKAAIGK